jgi:hypothetical protein
MICSSCKDDYAKEQEDCCLYLLWRVQYTTGCASVGVYVATKAFEKSLAASLGRRKMERYDVSVTCLLPGAVKYTEFASRSDVETAVCFQVPGYAKSPELRQWCSVTRKSIQDRRIMPHLPARVAGLIGEFAWSPSPLRALSKNIVEGTEQSPRMNLQPLATIHGNSGDLLYPNCLNYKCPKHAKRALVWIMCRKIQ